MVSGPQFPNRAGSGGHQFENAHHDGWADSLPLNPTDPILTCNSFGTKSITVTAASIGDLEDITGAALDQRIDSYFKADCIQTIFSELNDRRMVLRVSERVIELIFADRKEVDRSTVRGVAAMYVVDNLVRAVEDPRFRTASLSTQRCYLLQRSGNFPYADDDIAAIFNPPENRFGFHSYPQLNPLIIKDQGEALTRFPPYLPGIELLTNNEFVIVPLTAQALNFVQVGTIVALRPQVPSNETVNNPDFIESLARLGECVAGALYRIALSEQQGQRKAV